MFNSYVIEVDDREAGLILRNGSEYEFHSVRSVFNSMEGRRFSGPVAAERAARKLTERRA